MGFYDLTQQTADNIALGKGGSVYLSDTTAITGTFNIINVIEDCKFNVLTDASRTDTQSGNTNYLNSATAGFCVVVPAGTTLFGSFTAITLHSGVIIAYKGM